MLLKITQMKEKNKMLNVKSEKGFYYTNPQDYLDGKSNDLHETTYTSFGVQTHEDIYRDEVCGYGMGFAHFLGRDGITMTKEEFAKIIEKELAEFDYPFYVQKLRPSFTWREKGETFPIEDYSIFESISNNYRNDTRQVVAQFLKKAHPFEDRKELPEYLVVNVCFNPNTRWLSKEEQSKLDDFTNKLVELFDKTFPKNSHWIHTDTYRTNKVINGSNLELTKDINGKEVKVGDRVYYAPYAGHIDLGVVTKFTDISIIIDDKCYGQVGKVDIVKAGN